MITDSKYFYMYPIRGAGNLKTWCFDDDECVLSTVKHPTCIHVYMGVSWYGLTTLCVVTGTTGFDTYKISQPGRKPVKGVQSAEYLDVVKAHLVPEGQRLFANSMFADSWVLQQDGAPPHKGVQVRQYIKENVPGGLLPEWPGNSADLSVIENIWALMDRELRKREVPATVGDFKKVLEDIRESVSLVTIRNLIRGMRKRLSTVIERDGGHVGK
jgi:hypothetical protein